MVCVVHVLLLLLTCVWLSHSWITVVVDSSSGDDNNCLSVQDLLSANLTSSLTACRSLDRALGGRPGVVSTCSSVLSCASGVLAGVLDGVLIQLADGEHRLNACISITQSTGIRFEAINDGRATIKCATSSVSYSLIFCGTQNVTFTGIYFEECGPLSSNMFFNDSSDISFDRCVFRNNSGTPLRFQFSTRINLTSCNFIENVNLAKVEPDTENTTLTDNYDHLTTSGGVSLFVRNVSIDLIIQDCLFSSNSANRNPMNDTRPVLLKSNGHGGAISLRLVNSNGSQVTIEDCIFKNNMAEVDGGAIYLSLSDYSGDNVLTFRNNIFLGNKVEIASGGAISISSFNFTYNNMIHIEDSRFESNNGSAGGAFSMALYDRHIESTIFPDMIVFRNCSFLNNSAVNEGTAVGLFSLIHVDQVGFPVYFHDCTFTNNTSLERAKDTSAITAFRFPTVFSGNNIFEDNLGGGITLLNTRMQALANSSLLFLRNRAVFGAGIAMDDRCLLEISSDVRMVFMENTATESGGGIHVEFPPIRFVVDIFNRLCFLQYKDESGADVVPQEWKNVRIEFIGNRARLSGAAIFASDMQQCGWLGSDFTLDNTLIFFPPEDVLKMFPNYPFKYSNNRLFPEGESVALLKSRDLATAPSTIHVLVDHTLVQPGETLQINLLATDQVNNSREAIWSVEAPEREPNLDALSANNDTFLYVVPLVNQLPGIAPDSDNSSTFLDTFVAMPTNTESQPLNLSSAPPPPVQHFTVEDSFSSSFSLNFSLLRTLGNMETLHLNVSGCHPGYYLNSNRNKCECLSSNNSDILRCDNNMRYLYLREGYWAETKVDPDGVRSLITAKVQPGYLNCTLQGRLPGCLFQFDNINAQCTNGRTGPLCGSCTENRGVTLDLRACTSTTCYIGVVLFLFMCVSVVVVSMLILLFDIEIPNELKGFIFYAQVVGLLYSPYVVVQTDPNITQHTTAILTFLNLLGLSIPLPFCLSTSLRAPYVALLGYISPSLTILCVVLYIFGSRKIQILGNHSALKGITFLSLFIYKYVADTSFILISCLNTDRGLVFQYDGSQLCTSPRLAVFSLIGLFLVLFFVVPTPFLTSYICIRRPNHFQQYADVLTKGLRTKHRWWGGWDIGRRLPFVFISYFIVYFRSSVVLFLMSLVALATLIIHLFTKPFKKMHINIIETAILLNLLLVTVTFLDPSNSSVPFWFGTFLVLLPYFYATSYFCYLLFGKKLWRKIMAEYVARRNKLDGDKPDGDKPDGGSTCQADSGNIVPVHVHEENLCRTDPLPRGDSSINSSELLQPRQRSHTYTVEKEIDFIHFREPLLDDL